MPSLSTTDHTVAVTGALIEKMELNSCLGEQVLVAILGDHL